MEPSAQKWPAEQSPEQPSALNPTVDPKVPAGQGRATPAAQYLCAQQQGTVLSHNYIAANIVHP